VLAIAILVRAWQDRGVPEYVRLGHRNVLVTFAALVVAAMAFERVGAYATLGALAAILLFALARLALWRAALSATVGMVAVWALFKVLLGVQLPSGPF
jgi:Na+-transporting NADH:ubiquinone oxidoreductase subunit NqrB